MNYDVAIVGTGPAGAMAAIKLASSGYSIVLIEKEKLPRHKPCGGAIHSSVLETHNLQNIECISNRCRIVQYLNNFEDEIVYKYKNKSFVILLNRKEFDSSLIKKALESGGKCLHLLQESRVIDVQDLTDKVVLLLDNDSKIEAKYVIAADGALSRIAKCIGLMKNRKLALTVDAEIIATQKYFDDHCQTMIINYFCVADGYGWIFPKADRQMSCGVGTWSKLKNLRQGLDDFISRSFPEDSIEKVVKFSHPLPVFQGTEQIAKNRILLAGDAASLVDPVSGEGIRFALLSGSIAAGLVRDHLDLKNEESRQSIAEQYQSIINDKIGKELKGRLAYAFLAFKSNPDFFYSNFIKRQT